MANLRFLHACILTSMALAASTALSTSVSAQTADPAAADAAAAAAVVPRDPGVQPGDRGTGRALPGLTTTNADGSVGGEFAFFDNGKDDFAANEDVPDG